MKLLDIQRRMARDVMRPLTASGRIARRTEDGAPMAVHARSYLKPNDRLSSLDRLEIYNRQYWYRLLDSLAEDFPGLQAVLGKRAFAKLSVAYLRDCPSRSFTLRDLGSRLYKWIEANPAPVGRHRDLALDLVRFEWAHIEAFDEKAIREIGPEDLAELNPDLSIALQPYVRLLKLSYPVDELRASVDTGRTVSTRGFARASPVPLFLAVHRIEGEVCYRRLEAAEFAVLTCFERGGPLNKLLSRSLRAAALPAEEIPATIQAWFTAWAELGWLGSPEARLKPRGLRG